MSVCIGESECVCVCVVGMGCLKDVVYAFISVKKKKENKENKKIKDSDQQLVSVESASVPIVYCKYMLVWMC